MATADEITSLYQQDFGRAPDAAGLNYWAGSGLSGNDLNSAFLGSQEYQSQHPTGAGTGYQVPGGANIQDYSADRKALQDQITAIQQQITDVKAQIAAKKSQGWSLPGASQFAGLPGSGGQAGTVTDNGAVGTPTNTSADAWSSLTQQGTPITAVQQWNTPDTASNVAFH